MIEEVSLPFKCLNSSILEHKKKIIMHDLGHKDYIILSKLSDNARTSVTDISRHTGLGIDSVIYRKKTRNNNIIYGYRVVIDESMLGFEKYKLLVKMIKIGDETKISLLGFLKLDPATQYIKSCVGEWDFSITIIVHTTKELKQFIERLEARMEDNIASYTILPLFEEHKNTYFPKELENQI